MSTHPITPETKVPFPCWLYVVNPSAGARFAPMAWHYVTHRIDAGWLLDFCSHYSTLPESQHPEGVQSDSAHGLPKSCLNEGGSAVEQPLFSPSFLKNATLTLEETEAFKVGARRMVYYVHEDGRMLLAEDEPYEPTAPHPTLAQLVEGAAKELIQPIEPSRSVARRLENTDQTQEADSSEQVSSITGVILHHLSPEWERMERELGKAEQKYSTLTALLHELFPAPAGGLPDYKVDDVLRENAALRTRLRELEEDKARLDWVSEMDALPEWDDNGFWKIRYAGKWYSGNTVRAAIDEARKEVQ